MMDNKSPFKGDKDIAAKVKLITQRIAEDFRSDPTPTKFSLRTKHDKNNIKLHFQYGSEVAIVNYSIEDFKTLPVNTFTSAIYHELNKEI